MNVVYIIGNGFDLQVGLPTSYQDFYRYYTGLESKSESVKKLKEAIKDKPKDWSDLEMALGQYSAQTESVQEFCEAYDDLQRSLRDYILKIDELMKDGELVLNVDADTLERGFTYPESVFGSDETYTIEGEYESIAPGLMRGQNIYNASVITFNYTHVIEHYLKQILEDRFQNRSRYLNSVQHVHREVAKNQSVWVGVDNEEQVLQEDYRTNPEVRVRLLKPWILSSRSRRMLNDAKNLIQSADVLIIFGASLGPSDQTWAMLVSEKVSNGALVMLFIYNGKSYPSDNAKLNDQIRYRDEVVKKMEQYGVKILDDSRIFVEINSAIFTNDLPNSHDDNLKLALQKLSGPIAIAM
ncbi:MAG: hypothetical protein KBS80_05050 [Bacteroidales bacterium]|nr:hypothetical protein [Candidatus Cryptobacteroides choladohippi]